MSREQRAAIVEFSQDAICGLLCLPATARITKARVSDRGHVEIVVEHEDLDPVAEADAYPVRSYEIAGDRQARFSKWS